MSDSDFPPVSPISVGLACRCPRCGRGRLFDGYLTVAARCPICDLDLGAQDSGDGPAVFVVLILGFVVVALALLVEVAFSPPRRAPSLSARRSRTIARTQLMGLFNKPTIGFRGDRHGPRRPPALLETVGHRAAVPSEEVVGYPANQKS